MDKKKFLTDAKTVLQSEGQANYCLATPVTDGKIFASFNGFFGMVLEPDETENIFDHTRNNVVIQNLFTRNTVFSSGKMLLHRYKEIEFSGEILTVLEYMTKTSCNHVCVRKDFLEYFSPDAEFYSSALSTSVSTSGIFVVENGKIVGYIMPVNIHYSWDRL